MEESRKSSSLSCVSSDNRDNECSCKTMEMKRKKKDQIQKHQQQAIWKL